MGGNSVLKCLNKPSREGECAPSDHQVALSLFGAFQWRGLALSPRRRLVASPVRLPAAACGSQGDVAATVTAPLPGRADQELPGEGSWSWHRPALFAGLPCGPYLRSLFYSMPLPPPPTSLFLRGPTPARCLSPTPRDPPSLKVGSRPTCFSPLERLAAF